MKYKAVTHVAVLGGVGLVLLRLRYASYVSDWFHAFVYVHVIINSSLRFSAHHDRLPMIMVITAHRCT
eukprot:5399590-Amphidinium_carterae.1